MIRKSHRVPRYQKHVKHTSDKLAELLDRGPVINTPDIIGVPQRNGHVKLKIHPQRIARARADIVAQFFNSAQI
jgi:hypothetical protein